MLAGDYKTGGHYIKLSSASTPPFMPLKSYYLFIFFTLYRTAISSPFLAQDDDFPTLLHC